jgi:hypothetical protein
MWPDQRRCTASDLILLTIGFHETYFRKSGASGQLSRLLRAAATADQIYGLDIIIPLAGKLRSASCVRPSLGVLSPLLLLTKNFMEFGVSQSRS